MANIKTFQEALKFLQREIINETMHAQFQNPEVEKLADIITGAFSELEKEMTDYDE